MSRKRETLFMGIGILAGLALSGPVAQAATEVLTASHTSQTFYLNGKKVEFEAYSIHDNNFVKLRDVYPTGTVYGDFYRSYSNGPYGMVPNHCAGWATLCSDAAFGDRPWRRVNKPGWEDIRPGDLVRYDNTSGGHVVVVLDKTDEYIKVTESGTNNKARWGGKYRRWWLEEQSGYTCFTRYPQ